MFLPSANHNTRYVTGARPHHGCHGYGTQVQAVVKDKEISQDDLYHSGEGFATFCRGFVCLSTNNTKRLLNVTWLFTCCKEINIALKSATFKI